MYVCLYISSPQVKPVAACFGAINIIKFVDGKGDTIKHFKQEGKVNVLIRDRMIFSPFMFSRQHVRVSFTL